MATYGEWEYIRLTGNKGEQGIQGEQGEKGETGAQGIQGVKGDKGETGATGATGIGIASIVYQYATSATQTGTKSTYQDTIPTLSESAKYLWQKETINYTSGAPKVTEAIIGVYGDQGAKGDKGDKGDQGIQGIQGIQGETGAKGDKGDKGDTGATGAKGETGASGANAPNVKFQYSADGTNWSNTPSSTTQYMRSSNDNGATWTSAYKVKGETGERVKLVLLETVWHPSPTNTPQAKHKRAQSLHIKALSQPFPRPTNTFGKRKPLHSQAEALKSQRLYLPCTVTKAFKARKVSKAFKGLKETKATLEAKAHKAKRGIKATLAQRGIKVILALLVPLVTALQALFTPTPHLQPKLAPRQPLAQPSQL